MTAARRSVTLTPEGRIATRVRKITRFSLLALSALMIPIAMQAPSVSLYTRVTVNQSGYFPLLGILGLIFSYTKPSSAEISPYSPSTRSSL